MKAEMSNETPLALGIRLSHFILLGVFIALTPILADAGTWVAFQNSYTRGTGAPVTVTNTFTLLNPATQYTLKAFNGGLQNSSTELVSSSFVLLNGVQMIGPSDFSQNVAEVNVTIFPGLTNTLSVQVRGQPGGVLTVQVIGVDNDPPTITASVSPSPNAASWNNSPVTVTFTCSDKTSGVASCPSPVTVSAEGANQVVSGTATDLAGNTATTSVTINLDMTPPTITGTLNPPPDAGGYNSGPVTVTFTCSDALSGVASCSPAVSVTSEGSTQETGTATDFAGNTATTTVTVNISLSYFKIRSWQTGPGGNPKSPSGKCLDYGASPLGNGATVFLNECAVANPIRVVEVSICTQDPNNPNAPPICKPRTGSGNIALSHEVVLFAGNQVIGVGNPLSAMGPSTAPATTTTSATAYALELQFLWSSPLGAAKFTPEQQIWRLDGDSIILEGSSVDPTTNFVVPGPCINGGGVDANGNLIPARAQLCPPPPPQLVIQVENARGANGSPLVASVRNLSDNELWDFAPELGSRPYPTAFVSTVGGMPITTNYQLWNAICASPQATSAGPTVYSNPNYPSTYGQPVPCGTFNVGWGSVVVVTSPNNDCQFTDPLPSPAQTQTQDIGACINLTGFAPLSLSAGATVRGDRRGTHPGPQLFAGFSKEWAGLDCSGNCILDVIGDYVRVVGLRLKGQSRYTSEPSFKLGPINGISVAAAGIFPTLISQTPPLSLSSALASVTELIATIDHNEVSDWITGGIRANSPFSDDAGTANLCGYPNYGPSGTEYTCDESNQLVPPPGTPYPPASSVDVQVANVAGTLANIRVARNFLHHNAASETGYGIEMGNTGGRFLAEGNTFSWNRHDITASGEPHSEYHALHNLVMSGAPDYGTFIGRLQDFDVHGTGNPSDYFQGAGGFYAEIAGNTFLGGNGHDYALRGYPGNNSYYHNNVSRRKEHDAVHYFNCDPLKTLLSTCVVDDGSSPPSFPIIVSNSQFADSSPPYIDPTSTLGVGDFDGDGDDDLFMATGAGWYYSPAGKTEWRYLNSAPDTIGQLLFGDFDNDGRTDVVALRNGQLVVSWGGISAFELLNSTVPANCTMASMTVGDFNGVGRQTDIFCADPTSMTWWISYGGNTQFAMVNSSGFSRSALRFGHFAVCGTGVETDVFSVQSTGWYVSCGATTLWQRLGASLSNSADLVVADFNGDGIADVGMPCSSGWQISYGGTQAWSACNTYPSAFSLANGAVGRFSGGPGADILLWNYYNGQGAATLWDFPGGTGTPYQLSAQDVDMH